MPRWKRDKETKWVDFIVGYLANELDLQCFIRSSLIDFFWVYLITNNMSMLQNVKSLFTKYPLLRGMVSYSFIWPTSALIQQTIAGKTWGKIESFSNRQLTNRFSFSFISPHYTYPLNELVPNTNLFLVFLLQQIIMTGKNVFDLVYTED